MKITIVATSNSKVITGTSVFFNVTNVLFIGLFIFFFRMQDVIYRLSKVGYCVTLMFTKFTLKTNKALKILHKFLVSVIMPEQVQ